MEIQDKLGAETKNKLLKSIQMPEDKDNLNHQQTSTEFPELF